MYWNSMVNIFMIKRIWNETFAIHKICIAHAYGQHLPMQLSLKSTAKVLWGLLIQII